MSKSFYTDHDTEQYFETSQQRSDTWVPEGITLAEDM